MVWLSCSVDLRMRAFVPERLDRRPGSTPRLLRGLFRGGGSSWLPVLRTLPVSSGDVGLSFDDGPNEDSTLPLLDILDRYGARASFFLSGVRAVNHPAIIGEIVRRGHDVYAHGWRHVRHDKLRPAEIVESLERTEQLLRAWRRTPNPYLVRLPYGRGHDKWAVHQAVRNWRPDAQIAHWNAPSSDWSISARCSSRADVEQACALTLQELLAKCPVLKGSILLLHDQPIGSEKYSAEITLCFATMLLDHLDRLGLRAVPITPRAPSGGLISVNLLT